MSCRPVFNIREHNISLLRVSFTKFIFVFFIYLLYSLFYGYCTDTVPYWVSVLPKEESKIFNIGFSDIQNVANSKREATTQGRLVLCRKIAKALEPYLLPVCDDGFTYFKEENASFSALFLQMIISKVNTEQIYRDENKNTYVLVSILKSDVELQYQNLIQKRIDSIGLSINQTEEKMNDLFKKLDEYPEDEQIEEIKLLVTKKAEKIMSELTELQAEYKNRLNEDIIALF